MNLKPYRRKLSWPNLKSYRVAISMKGLSKTTTKPDDSRSLGCHLNKRPFDMQDEYDSLGAMCSFFYRHDFKQFLILCVLTGKTCCMSHLIQSSVLCASGFYSLLKMEALFFSETPDYKMLLYKAHNIDITAHTTFSLTLYFALTTSPVTPRTPQTQTHTSVMV